MMATYTVHITTIFRVPDLSIFGILKPINGSVDESGMVHKITAHALKMIRASPKSCKPPHPQAILRKAGFEFASMSEPAFVTFREERLRETGAFREMRDIDLPMEGLSRRRQ
jgi:hypothetical protein